jgi:hypothetical protein
MRPGREADPLTHSSAEVKNRVIPLLSLRAFVAYERAKPTYVNKDTETAQSVLGHSPLRLRNQDMVTRHQMLTENST